jgi:hypothetical protein
VLVKPFVIAADEAVAQWYSLLSPRVIHGWEDLKQQILSNFHGFQRPMLTESDLFSCKQKDKEPLQNYFRRFVHLRAQAPNVLDDLLPSVGTILPILGGSALEFDCKKDRKHYLCEVCNICVEGRVERTRWSHIPITFSEEDVRLQGFPHNDALVIEANIASWTLGKLLLDNGFVGRHNFRRRVRHNGVEQKSFTASTHHCMVLEAVSFMQ